MYHLWLPVVTLFSSCRPAFKNKTSFYWAFLVVVGFCFQGGQSGVTGLCRVLDLAPSCYTSMLGFFNSSAVMLDSLRKVWFQAIWKAFESRAFLIDQRPVIAVDEIKIGKEGCQMPGVRSLYQSSQNNSKSPFIMGHNVLVFAFLVNSPFARVIPFFSQILGGLRLAPRVHKSLIEDTVSYLLSIFKDFVHKPIIVADALYAVKSFIIPLQAIGIDVISRMKNNSVAAHLPEIPTQIKRGRPKKYGVWFKLISIFDSINLFSEAKSPIPGEDFNILYYATPLLTRWLAVPALFVFVQHPKRGKIILVSSSLTLSPLDIYLSYYYRFQIEVAFKQLKHSIYAFAYRFWTTALTTVQRGGKDHYIHRKTTSEKDQILKTFNSYHLFMQLAFMAFGILQYLSIFYPQEVYASFRGWLRTIRPGLAPSIEISSKALQEQGEYFFMSSEIPDEIAKFMHKKRAPGKNHQKNIPEQPAKTG